MGTMQEKRSIKAAEEGWLPQRQKELAEICGKEIPYEVDWNSFAGNLKAIDWLEFNGPQQVSGAFRGICRDEIGKEAVQEGVKKIVLRNVPEIADKALTFTDGVLELRCAFAQSPRGRFKDREIHLFLEPQL